MPILSNFYDILPRIVEYSSSFAIQKKYPVRPKDVFYDGVNWETKKQHFQELFWLETRPNREIVETLFDLLKQGWLQEEIQSSAYIVFESLSKSYYCIENINLESPNKNRPVIVLNLDILIRTSWISKQEHEKQELQRKRLTVLRLLSGFLTLGFMFSKN